MYIHYLLHATVIRFKSVVWSEHFFELLARPGSDLATPLLHPIIHLATNCIPSLGSSLIIFLLFYFSVPWSKMTAWGTLISIDSATWIFPQNLRGKAKNDNAIR